MDADIGFSYLAKLKRNKNLPQQLTLDTVSPATRLLEKRRQMFEVQEQLDAQKAEFRKKEEQFKQREESLKKKDLELQESLIRFNKFLQENDSKRLRAERKAADEKKNRAQREQDIIKLKDHLEKLQETKDKVQEALERNKKYTKFLEQVVEEKNEEFPEIGDVLTRHETLEETNRQLFLWSQNLTVELEEFREKFANERELSRDVKLEQNNVIAKLQERLEEIDNNIAKSLEAVDRNKEHSANAKLNLGQIVLATNNLFDRVEDQSNVRRVESDQAKLTMDAVDKLRVIGDYLEQLVEIAEECPPEAYVQEKETLFQHTEQKPQQPTPTNNRKEKKEKALPKKKHDKDEMSQSTIGT